MGAAFSELFQSFTTSAFRLESRERYDSPNETEPLRKFLAGEPDDLAWFANWLGMIRASTAAGRQFSRVRVVSRPLSDYSRFGLWCAQFTNEAGEDIRYLDRAQAGDLPGVDFWLFDEVRVARLHFGEADRFLGAEIITEPALVDQYRAWRDQAWRRARKRDEFAPVQS